MSTASSLQQHVTDIREEIASALTHGLGAVTALGAGAVLITLAAIYGDGWQLASAIVFGVALLLLYTASTLYHAIQHPVAKGRLKVFDHCAIYVLIAGTYTPFTLIGLRGPWGWGLFAAIWTLALGGVVAQAHLAGARVSDAAVMGEGFPPTLGAFGFFADAARQVPAPGVIAYELNTPLWSDGAEKLRFI